ncbi:MAG: DUF6514 family protein [Clostridiales bacterium]|nr:DUF6514 family protein [Clostridiales bacterium]MCD8215731.1 DUF6514 family protein [Clostridiales bacterium]
MTKLCEETVHIDLSELDVKYSFMETEEEGKPVYGFIAELYENGVIVGRAEEKATASLSKAVKLYGMLIKSKATPVDLKYVIEDFV